jgi:hypothetical protein
LGGLPSTSLFKDDRLGGKAMHPDASDYSGSDDDDDDGESIGSYSSSSSSDDNSNDDRGNGYFSRDKTSRPFKRFKSNNYNGYYKHPYK